MGGKVHSGFVAHVSPAVPDAFPDRGEARRSIGATLRAYVALTKPRIIELLLVTTVPAMILAAGELPSLWLMARVLGGGTLAAGGAHTINCYLERDRDQLMRRTAHRPLPRHDIPPGHALAFGVVIEVLAFAFLWVTVNPLSALLAVSATLFYVFVYTIWLKPRTTQNIVIGGAAGAVPVLVGWAAVTGTVGAPAWVLFAVVFFWTPPHFWALSLRYQDDYAAAGIPMLPVVKGARVAARQIAVYSVVVVGITLLLVPVASMGVLYVVLASVFGAVFVARAIRLHRDFTPQRAIKLFTFSNAYLALVFAAVAADVLFRAAR